MVGCSAPNCTGRYEKGKRMFRFPTDPSRRKRWSINCRRDKWFPSKNACLCQDHFEKSQFEGKILDGKAKLKPNAIPTLFDVPNCPKLLTSQRRVLKRTVSTEPKKIASPGDIAEEHCYCRKMKNVSDIEGAVFVENTEMLEVSMEENSELGGGDTVEQVDDGCVQCREKELEIRRLKRQIHQLKQKIDNVELRIGSFLNKDQLDAMKNSSGKLAIWENETVSTALKIRCATGVQGYKFLSSLGYPLPSYRTLCRRIVALDFAPGIQHTVLEWMQLKGTNMTATEKLCSLMVDEIQIAKAVDFDPGLHRLIGYISSEFSTAREPDSTVASHIICFMVKGITTKWRQLIAYFYTGMSVSPYQLWGMIKNIICHLGNCEYKVVNVVSDMASSNQGMWKEAGVITNRFQISSCVAHPYFAEENLYFMADVPHLLKNLRSALLKYDLELPKSTVEKYNLPTSIVSSKFSHALVELQDGKELKLAPKLARKNVNPSHYEKMRENTASQLLSHSTASALRALVAHESMNETALTTAFFCEFVNNWFDITNCRHMGDALFVNSEKKLELLSEALHVVKNMKFVATGWKPVQSGLHLSTTTILRLHQKLVINGEVIFLMAGRLTQDALENLFSQVRGKGVQHPKPTQFRVAVKLISVSQIMSTPTSTNYENDDTPHLPEFIKTNLDNQEFDSKKETSNESSAMEVLLGAASVFFDTCEADALYYLSGWAVLIEVKKQDCGICKDAFVSMERVNPDECPQSLLASVLHT